MLYWLSSCCIVTVMIIAYKMVVLLMAYCTCTVLLLYDNIICGQFVFCFGGQSVSCGVLWQPSDCMAIFVIFVLCYYRRMNMMMMMMKLAFFCFDTIPARDRRTDGQTDRQTDRHVPIAKTRASIASRV